jgi:transcriptional regulator with XRE-family HTH domain
MGTTFEAASLVREARTRAGLSQRELARRAGAAQSAVSRIEGGKTDPSTGTLASLLAAAGFELRTDLTPATVTDTHMLNDVARIMRLTPEQRLREVGAVSWFVHAARRV